MKSTSSSCSSPSSCGGWGGRIASAGCLSRILRRILCFSNLPLYSFDHFRADERESPAAIGPPGATPGVVARLMGLDSIPRVKPVEESPSLGSADQFQTSRPTLVRRLRDIPPYQELEDDKFFILSFEKRRERKSSRNSRMEENGKRENSKRHRQSFQGRNKENEDPESLLLQLNDPCKRKEKSTKKMAKKYAIAFENEDESENSSPNSVLEFLRFSADPESFSSGETSRLANSKSRRPLSEELESCGDSEGNLRNGRLDREGENLVISRHEIGKLAAMETVRSSWLHDEVLKNKHCLLEIGRDVASNIFDHLLEELLINIQQF